MAKNKLKKFDEIKKMPNVLQPDLKDLEKGFKYKGKWREMFFLNSNPIILELGCGKGEYTIGLAKKNTNQNYIGIDIKGARIYDGALKSVNEKMHNVAFLRIRIEWIEKCFALNEINEIWITFPDPQMKIKRAKKRLTHPIFLRRYHNILKQNAVIHLKTDSSYLFAYTLGVIDGSSHELLNANSNIYDRLLSENEDLNIKTFYEKKFLSNSSLITYLCFRLNY